MEISFVIKLLSCIIHTALGIYVLLRNPRHRLNQTFSLAVLSTGVMEFGYFMLLINPEWLPWMYFALIGQVLMHSNVVFFSLIYGRGNQKPYLRKSRFYLVPLYLAVLAFIVTILSGKLKIVFTGSLPEEPDASYLPEIEHALVFSSLGSLFLAFLIICILISLINMENTYRNLGQLGRRIRYPAIVFMAAFSLRLLIYSLAIGLSYMRIEVLSAASITLMVTNICMAYPVLRPEPVESRIYVGRGIIAKSYTLLLAGIYLLIIGMLGKIAQIVGRNLNFLMAFIIVFFIILVAIVIILSRSIKQRVQLFIERNFYRSKYDYRREWENFSRRVFSILSTKELLQEVIHTVSETINADGVFLMLLDEGKGEFRLDTECWIPNSQHQIEASGIQPSISVHDEFLDWLWRYGKPVRIVDGKLKASEILSNTPHIPDVLSINLKPNNQAPASGVLVPIITNCRLIGIMCLGGKQGSSYSQEDLDILETMSNQISIAIMNAKTSQELALSRQLESFNRLSVMLLHDLKSSASMLSLVIQNAADNMDNPEFQKDALNTMSNVVNRIQKLIMRLSAAPQKLEAQLELKPSDMVEIISNAISRSGVRNISKIKVVEDLKPTQPVMVDPENMERVALNLLLNSIEAIKDEGTITISTNQSSHGHAEFSIADTGCGMSQDFINNSLFQPFRTTKERGLGIGLYQCKGIIEAMDGSIGVQSEEGAGSIFTVRLTVRDSSREIEEKGTNAKTENPGS